MSTNRTNPLTYIPEAAECHWIESQSPDDYPFTCQHPDPNLREDEHGSEMLAGFGDAPAAAYADFLEKLSTWQAEQLDKQYDYACEMAEGRYE